jgi:Protein of unknown function (DUF1553)/Protein of unknown function (DUF1549)/Planctomycete cytochrome C
MSGLRQFRSKKLTLLTGHLMRFADKVRKLFLVSGTIGLCLLVLVCSCSIGQASGSDNNLFFQSKIEPVLKKACYSCHSSDSEELGGGLSLESPSRLRTGGDSGQAINLEQPEQSLILQALRHEGGLAMPPDGPKLDPQIINDFQHWLETGAPDPRPETDNSAQDRMDAARHHWAFQPVSQPKLPTASKSTDARQAIDMFLLARFEQQAWQFAEPASKRDWLRRVTFNTTGLPPTGEAMEAFESDNRPDAEQRVIDRLLASPAYGQRMAQMWLDVVRYAESEGYEYDRHIPDAWRYRDYVINAFNADKPYNRFLVEQIAGDELDGDNRELLTAAVFHRLGPVRRNAGNPDIALSRNEVLTERTDILGVAFLGMTIGCARCHNHKLEPITQKDYYQLQAYLAATAENNVSLASDEDQAKWDATTKRLKDEIKELQQQSKSATGAVREKLSKQIEALDNQLPAPLATIPSIRNDLTERTNIHLLRRGVWENKGPAVLPRPPAILVSNSVAHIQPDAPNPRTYLAEWLTSPANPLTIRVIANRIWQHHFGSGLVKTANDFGIRGDRPSHPELLDWMASNILAHDWELKPLHRQILLSQAYRQSHRPHQIDQVELNDPENRLLSYYPRRRLSGEEVRDAMLFVSEQINMQMGGPSVMLPADPELVQLLYKPSQWVVTGDKALHNCRSVYLFAKRNLRLPLMENLDAPPLLCSCAKRESSTHAPQALELMNGWQSNALAIAFAQRLMREAGSDRSQLIQLAFTHALGRCPTEKEIQVSENFLSRQSTAEFALAMFNLNEFLYVR